jgi:hypothetical protein
MAVLTIAGATMLVAVPDHARLMINSGVFLHQSENDMIQLLVSVFELSLDLAKPAFYALQCTNVFR